MFQRTATVLPLLGNCTRRSLQPVRMLSDMRRSEQFNGREMGNMDRNVPIGDRSGRRPEGLESARGPMPNFTGERSQPSQDNASQFPGNRSWTNPQGSIYPSSSFRVNMDVHGFNPEDIRISLKEGVLEIAGHRLKTAEDGGQFRQAFTRQQKLPENLNELSLKSYYHENGFLTVEGTLGGKGEVKSEIPVHQFTGERGERPS